MDEHSGGMGTEQWTQIIIALIVGMPLIIASTANLIVSIRNGKRAQKVENKLDNVHSQINGKMEKLLEVTSTAAQARGKLEGKAEQKEQQKTGNT